MIKVYICNKSNHISRVFDFKKFFQCIDSEMSLTHCTEMSAVEQCTRRKHHRTIVNTTVSIMRRPVLCSQAGECVWSLFLGPVAYIN